MRNDLDMYDRHASSWWDPTSRFAASLHGLNRLRLAHVMDEFGPNMQGMVVVDLGCGGGLFAEPLALRGAVVVGIDASAPSLAVAQAHGVGIAGLRYELGDVRAPPVPSGCADLVCCADVLEHVDEWRRAVTAAAQLLRPGGKLYVSTINRTWRARLLAVYLAETLRVIPPGTHDPARFIRPSELTSAATAAGLHRPRYLGERLLIIPTLRAWAVRLAPGPSTAMGYAAWFQRGP